VAEESNLESNHPQEQQLFAHTLSFQTFHPPPPTTPQPQGINLDTLTLDTAVSLIATRVLRLTQRGLDPYAIRPQKGGRKKTKAAKSGSCSHGDGGDGGPKKLNGYQLFAKSNRQRLLDETPGATARQAFGLVAGAWKGLGDEERLRWNEDAKRLSAAAAAAAGAEGEGAPAAAAATKLRAKRKAAASASAAAAKAVGKGAAAKAPRKSSRTAKAAAATTTSSSSSSSSRSSSSSSSSRKLTGYNLFLRTNKGRWAGAAGGSVAAAAAEWRGLGADEKLRYSELAKQEQQQKEEE